MILGYDIVTLCNIILLASVPDLPQGQLGLGLGPEIQGAQNHESKKKNKEEKY